VKVLVENLEVMAFTTECNLIHEITVDSG